MSAIKHLNVVGNSSKPVPKINVEHGLKIELAILALAIHAETLLNLLVTIDDTVVQIDACLIHNEIQLTITKGTESPIF